jgi:hypothetical protein
MSSEGVIKIKGDTADFDGKIEKSIAKTKQLGQHTQTAAGHAKSFGDAWSHANTHLERSLLRGITIAHVFREAAAAAKEFQDESAKASKSVGGNALKRDLAARQLGLSSEQAEAAVGGAGAATADERNSFFASLADIKVGRGKRALTTQEAFRLQSARNSGLYDDDELKKIAESGDLSKIDVAGRLGGLGEAARAEYNTRSIEYSAGERAEEARYKKGFGTRAADATINARNAEHPIAGAFQSFVGAATSAVGGKDVITVFDRIANNTDVMAGEASKPSEPTLAPGAE